MAATYTYDVTKLADKSKDLMRFELGDTDISGGEDTAALTDEEINAMLTINSKWKQAKYKLVESVYMRYAKEVQMSTSGLSLGFQARADHWAILYKDLKKELSSMGAPSIKTSGPPYFTSGMMRNPGTEGRE